MKTGWIWGVSGICLGFASAAVVLRGERTEDSSDGPPLSIGKPGARRGAGNDGDRLRRQAERLQEEVDRLKFENAMRETSIALLKAQLQGGPSGVPEGKASADPEEVRRQGEALRGEFQKAFDAKDGKGAIQALARLIKLGPAAYPLAAELWLKVHADFKSGNSLGLSPQLFFGGEMGNRGFLEWALQDASLDRALRMHAVGSLPWLEPEGGAAALLASVAASERDPELLKGLARQIGGLSDPAGVAVLADRARDPALRGDVRESFVSALQRMPGADATRALEALRYDPDPKIRETARVALVAQNPPAAGVVLTSVGKDSNAAKAGLKPGDLILSSNQQPIRSMNDLAERLKRAKPKEQLFLQVMRDGAVLALPVHGGRLDAGGDYVQPR